MSVIGSLIFCTDCGNLLRESTGNADAILHCDICGTRNKGGWIEIFVASTRLVDCSLLTYYIQIQSPKQLYPSLSHPHSPQHWEPNDRQCRPYQQRTGRLRLSSSVHATTAGGSRCSTLRYNCVVPMKEVPCSTDVSVDSSMPTRLNNVYLWILNKY